jgi:hypothetical protein
VVTTGPWIDGGTPQRIVPPVHIPLIDRYRWEVWKR